MLQLKNSKSSRIVKVSSHKRSKGLHAKSIHGDNANPRGKTPKNDVELFTLAASAYSKRVTLNKESARASLVDRGIITPSGRLTARYSR